MSKDYNLCERCSRIIPGHRQICVLCSPNQPSDLELAMKMLVARGFAACADTDLYQSARDTLFAFVQKYGEEKRIPWGQ
jgi:hypothetical protein